MTALRARYTLPKLTDRLAADRHGLPTIVVLHLAPGVAFTAAALGLGRLAAARGLPPVFGLLAASAGVLVPLELGLMAAAGRRRSGRWSLRAAVGLPTRLPARRLLLVGTATFAWAATVFVMTAPVGEALRGALFAGWPAELDYAGHLSAPDRYSRTLLATAWALGLVVTSVAVPVVEECYFRGFLLPRLAHLGRWAPVVNTVLFAAYHLWSPWQIPTRVVALLPLVRATWRTRCLRLAIGVHVGLNLVGDTLASAPVVFR